MTKTALRFGVSAKKQIGERIAKYVSTNFQTSAEAARSLGISPQRLSSYLRGVSMPGADLIDQIQENWGLDLLDGARVVANVEVLTPDQLSLFTEPVTLRGAGFTVVIQRRGPGLVASFELQAEVKLA